MDMLINFIMVIISQYTYMSHEVVNLKYVQFLFVIYISLKLKKF